MGQAARAVSRQVAAEDTRSRILEAGERVFAESGFAGASMRTIAETAGVAQGLLHYHFENKRRLYAAVVGWRADAINAERLTLLEELDAGAPVEAILEALFRPALGRDAGGEAYGRIMASLMTGDAMHQDLVREHYDATAERFIDALQASAGCARERAAWGYSLAIHVLVAGMARTGRSERLAEADAPATPAVLLERLVSFAAGGIERLRQP